MSIVDFNTVVWKDSWFRKLSTKAKNLFIFLWTNDHKNLACLYEIDIETMSFYTGLSIKDVKDTLSILYPKVKYDNEKEVVWVVNFVRHQFMRTKNTSPKIIKGIENNLIQINGHFLVKEFLEEYQSLNLSYPYTIDRVSKGYLYPPGAGEGAGEGEGIKKGKKKYLEFVFLTKEEHEKLTERFGSKTKEWIERLNDYLGSKGKKYKSHYHTILAWHRKDKGENNEDRFNFK